MTDIEPEGGGTRSVSVWEPKLRIWHWTNALTILLLFETYLLFNWHRELGLTKATTALFEKAHIYLGWVFILLFLGRLHLLFRGKTFSRLPDFLPRSPDTSILSSFGNEIRNHVRSMKSDSTGIHPSREPGHDPLARSLYLMLFTFVFPLQILTGILWSSVRWGFWPLPSFHSLSKPLRHTMGEILSDIHATGMYVIVGFVVLHIAGVVIDECRYRSGILSSMIHGKKRLNPADFEIYRERTKTGDPVRESSPETVHPS